MTVELYILDELWKRFEQPPLPPQTEAVTYPMEGQGGRLKMEFCREGQSNRFYLVKVWPDYYNTDLNDWGRRVHERDEGG